MKERILFMLLSVTVIPVLSSIVALLEKKAASTESELDDMAVLPFRMVVELLKSPEFMEELKK